MHKFTIIEFLPMKYEDNSLNTLRSVAQAIGDYCGLGQGEERESSHYVEQTYFLWKRNDCSIKLFWNDEDPNPERLELAIDCEDSDSNKIATELLLALTPYIRNSTIKYQR